MSDTTPAIDVDRLARAHDEGATALAGGTAACQVEGDRDNPD